MASQFRNRLVGTIVVVALGVIFLPDILDGKKERKQEEFAEIPLRPATSPQGKPETFEVLQVADTMSLAKVPEKEHQSSKVSNGGWTIEKNAEQPKEDTAKQQISHSNSTKAENQPENNSTTLSSPGWTVQMGSFRDISNVKALVNQLRSAGFTAYTLPKTPVAGSLTKVFVGPDISKDKMLQLQPQVEKLTKLSVRVVPFNPIEQ